MTNIRRGLTALAIAVGATFGAVGAASTFGISDPLSQDVGGIFGGGGGAPQAAGELGDVGGIFGGGGG